ncbi:hypothetical protein Ssi03_62580 [Sphaerisporangium siamense]|uniref:Uncharacterized protein n=1 Tax=Sphaerisporangium siamense TaxID=795645 RepID=A0A7W7GD26_9ACTN|nr:hypothetical protein [Sphaerisporangium siamense]MBB4702566.1 hypothetical protein [Sphaerisporangium siamense]GII88268.1 hypothetical protein Ssi03_62580 [Sphaerisporangium siamense]
MTTREEAARAMGVAPREVNSVTDTQDGAVALMASGARRLIGDDGYYALDDHADNAHLRRAELTEPDIGGPDADGQDDAPEQVPDGTVEQVMTWVGEDAGRARAALEAEESRPSPRKSLITRLEELL